MVCLIFLAKLYPSLPIIWKLLWLVGWPAEKDLLQARVKAINSILDNVAKQTELCRSQLASILSTQRLRECQGFIEKVGEIRFTKVEQRQLNKFNNLLNKKEGNITRVKSSSNLVASQAGRCSPPPREGSSLAASQAGSQACQAFQAVASQADAHLPPEEGSNLVATQATQAGNPPGNCSPSAREGSNLAASQATQAGRPVTSFSPKEGGSLVASPASQAGTHLPSGEGSNSGITQAVPPSLVVTLPPKQAVRPPLTPLLGKALSKQATTSPQVRQVVKLLGQAGKTPGIQPGKDCFPGEQHCLPGRQCWFPGKQSYT